MGRTIQNIAYQSLYQILIMILPLVTVPYVARVLGADLIGTYSYTSAIVSYFVLFAMLGINTHGSRTIAKAENREERSQEFSNLLFSHLMVSAAVFVGYIAFTVFFAEGYFALYLIQGLLVVGACLDISWFYFGIEEFKLTVTRNLIIKVITVVSIFAFVKSSSDFYVYVLIMSMGVFGGQLVLWPFVRKYIDFSKPDLSKSLEHIKPMVILFVAVLATSIYHTIGKVFLGLFGTMSSVGYYEYADKFVQISVSLITAVGTVMLPRMSSLFAKGKSSEAREMIGLSIEAMMIVASGLSFGLVAICDYLAVVFLGRDFTATGSLLLLMAPAILFIAFSNVVRTQYIIPKGKDKIYVAAVIIAAVTNLVLNYALIQIIGVEGAAISSSAAYVVVCVIQAVCVRRELNLGSLIKVCIGPVIAGAFAALGAVVTKSFLQPTVLSLITIIALFVILYATLMLVCLTVNQDSKIRDRIVRAKKG